MNNKKKTVLLVLLYLIGFVVQIFSFILSDVLGFKASLLLRFSGAIPLAAAFFVASTMISQKYKFIKYILYFFVGSIVFTFLVLCVASVFTDFNVTNGGGIIFE